MANLASLGLACPYPMAKLSERKYKLLRDVAIAPQDFRVFGKTRDAKERVECLWFQTTSLSDYLEARFDEETTVVDIAMLRLIFGILVEELVSLVRAYTPPIDRGVGLFEGGYYRLYMFVGTEHLSWPKRITHDQRFRILAAVSENAALASVLKALDRRQVEEYRSAMRAAHAEIMARICAVSEARGTPGLAMVILPTDSMDGLLASLEDQSRNPGDFDFDGKRQRT